MNWANKVNPYESPVSDTPRVVSGAGLQYAAPLLEFVAHWLKNSDDNCFRLENPGILASVKGYPAPYYVGVLPVANVDPDWGVGQPVPANHQDADRFVHTWTGVNLDAPTLKPREMVPAEKENIRNCCNRMKSDLEMINTAEGLSKAEKKYGIVSNIRDALRQVNHMLSVVDGKPCSERMYDPLYVEERKVGGHIKPGNLLASQISRVIHYMELLPKTDGLVLPPQIKQAVQDLKDTWKAHEHDFLLPMHHEYYQLAEAGLNKNKGLGAVFASL